MSESIHETDQKKADVAIAAESNLDREGAERGDGSDGSVNLIMSALEKMALATDQLAQQMNERLVDVERDIDVTRSSSVSDLDGGLQAQIDELEQHIRESVDEQFHALRKELEKVREDMDTQRKDQRSWWEDEIASLRNELSELKAATEDGFSAAERDRAERLESALHGQRTMVSDLAEGIALVQTSMEERISEIEEHGRQHAGEELERWDRFTESQEERLDSMAEQTRELRELGQRIQSEHEDMVRVLEQEKDRAEQAVAERQREQARRINNSGVARYHAGDYAQAKALFEQAVEADQLFAEAFNNLGLSLTELGEHEDATVAFETAIEINPELGAGYNNLGYVLYLQENFEAAIEMYNEAIGREHDTSAAYTNLGNAWQKLGKSEKAVESWKLALEVDPSNERARRYLDRFAGPAA
jgi:tetratricopeptide (TPR) repeat protein